MRAITSASLCALALALAGAAQAQDIERGRLLYETHCGNCHTERLHTRENSIIRSYGALRAEVGKRAAMTNRAFTPGELEEIIEFLDRSHYRLDLPLPPPRRK
jgi:mono/diheme cytochrome c family protein